MWHSDGGVRTGLRVADIQALFEVAGVDVDERKELYALLQECESEALKTYAEQRELDDKERERKQKPTR